MFFSSKFTRDNPDANAFEKHTYSDWYLIPTSRPCIQPPNPKTQVVDVPGANGVTDLSRSLTGYPVFMNRTGSNEYMIENDKWPKWIDPLTEVTNKLNGQHLRMYFEDDEPEYYYVGTWSVTNYQAGEVYSTLNIEYDLFPYKMKDGWSGWPEQQWDTFNFNHDYIVVDVTNHWHMLRVELNEGESSSLFRSRSGGIDDLVSFFGEMPTHPLIDIKPVSGTQSWRVLLTFTNSEIGIDGETEVIEGTAERTNIDISKFVMTMFNPQNKSGVSFADNNLSLQAKSLQGSVIVTAKFKTGRL